MNIQNPSINDICFCDFVSLKSSVTHAKGHKHDMTFDVYNCTEKINTYGQIEDAKYEVRDIDYDNNKVIIFGKTKTVHPNFDESWGCYDKYVIDEMEIGVEDIDTLYSQKRGNEYLDKVWKNMIELTYLIRSKFKEIFTEKYYDTICGKYDSEFDPCHLIDYVMNGHEWSKIKGFNNIVNDYFCDIFVKIGKFNYSTHSNCVVWNEEALQGEHYDDNYEDISLEEYIKYNLEKLASYINKDYRYILNEIETNSIKINKRDCCFSYKKPSADEIKFLSNALTKYYEWMMNLITPLIESDINAVHNDEIDSLIKSAEDEIKSYEYKIESMFEMIEEKKKEIEKLKAEYK